MNARDQALSALKELKSKNQGDAEELVSQLEEKNSENTKLKDLMKVSVCHKQLHI